MSSEVQSKYGLSSWNYGSFHCTNPCYSKPKNQDNQKQLQRSQSANFNKYGKRQLSQEDKIVTEEYLKAIKDSKTIKKLSRKDSFNNPSYNQSQSVLNQSNTKKNLKYQLTFEEWTIMKNAQNEIYKNVQNIKDTEDKKFELFNKKVDENYDVIKQENYQEWLKKKNIEKEQEIKIKQFQEERKLQEQMRKKEEGASKFDYWIKRQAQIDELKILQKRELDQRKKDEENRKKQEDEQRKAYAKEAFRMWKDTKKVKEKSKTNSNSSQTNKNRNKAFKIIIGPYSNAKQLREIQNKINILDNTEQEVSQQDMQDERSSNNLEGGSIHNISSINKDTQSY